MTSQNGTDPQWDLADRMRKALRESGLSIQCRYTKGHHGQHCGASFSTGDVFWDNPVLPTPTPPVTAGQSEAAS